MDTVLLVAGVGLAVYGAYFLVEGGSAIAKRFNIPTLVIGSTIVAFGTSMPEFTVNINSALAGNTDLAMGNILGSNLFNICAIIGIVALITPIKVGDDSASKDFPMCLIAAAMVGICGNQIYFDKINYHELFLSDGLVFLAFFVIFMRYVYGEAAAGSAHHHQARTRGSSKSGEDGEILSVQKSVAFIVVGLVGLVFGGEFIVDGATGVARSLGMPERVIGLVIVGPGTSVPELVASIAAARRKDAGMVIGNVLGSNIFNIFFTLGATTLIRPVPLDLALNKVILINVAVTAFLVMWITVLRKRQIGRIIGALLILVYAGYIADSLMYS
jgi:cation:H+ antiporter